MEGSEYAEKGLRGPSCPRAVEPVPTRVATPWGRAAGTSLGSGTRKHADAGGEAVARGVRKRGSGRCRKPEGGGKLVTTRAHVGRTPSIQVVVGGKGSRRG